MKILPLVWGAWQRTVCLFALVLASTGAGAGGPVPEPHPPLSGELIIGGSGAALGLMQKIGEAFGKEHPAVTVKVLPSLGSGGGIKALAAGHLGLSVSSRPLTPAEHAEGMKPLEIARTPLVFVAGPGVGAKDISLEQLVAFYSGAKTQWPNGTLVRPVLRPLEDIDTVLVKALSPAMANAVQMAHQRPGKNIAITDTDSATVLEQVPGAIGTSTLALIKTENRLLNALSIQGVPPVIGNEVNPQYPHQKSIYLIVPARPSALAEAFLRFTESPVGTKILAQNGSIPLRAVK